MIEISILGPKSHQQILLDDPSVIVRGALINGQAVPALKDCYSVEFSLRIDAKTNRVAITNRKGNLDLPWSNLAIQANRLAMAKLPFQIKSGQYTFEFQATEHLADSVHRFRSIPRKLDARGRMIVDSDVLGKSPSSETISNWLTAIASFDSRELANRESVLQKTAESVCDPGGMNGAIILVREDEQWNIACGHLPRPELGISFSRELVDIVANSGQTHFHENDASQSPTDSIVAAPFFNGEGNVSGIVYGMRFMRAKNLRRGIRPLEALWVQLLANSVGNRIQMIEAQAEAARNRVILEQSFSEQLVGELINNPHALESCEREVTTLFADLRGYTRISQNLDTQATHALLREILETLTKCIHDEEGVIIDYYGDGLAAMWNAPVSQSDHVLRACRAAVAMQKGIQQIATRWSSYLTQYPLRLGVGVHTGTAQVGNSGTNSRMKYGPRGNSVIVASRLEAATRAVAADIVISPQVAEVLSDSACLRRICCGALPGLNDPIDLFELVSLEKQTLNESTLHQIEQYERVLELLDQGELTEAEQLLVELGHADTDLLSQVMQPSDQNSLSETASQRHVVDLTKIKT